MLEAAHSALRLVARGRVDDPDLSFAAGQAVQDAGVYGVRERLLMSGSTELVQAGETAFGRLMGVRDAVRGGAALSSRSYHDAYHAYADALWALRRAVRTALGQRPITPSEHRPRAEDGPARPTLAHLGSTLMSWLATRPPATAQAQHRYRPCHARVVRIRTTRQPRPVGPRHR
jgi:hypothetical protein